MEIWNILVSYQNSQQYDHLKVTKHFNQNNILYDLQHGFREKRSYETQLIQLMEDLARNMTSGKQTDLILLTSVKPSTRLTI